MTRNVNGCSRYHMASNCEESLLPGIERHSLFASQYATWWNQTWRHLPAQNLSFEYLHSGPGSGQASPVMMFEKLALLI
ncbi:hypothetical protein NLU13_8260 [Sarocladium strictum]|uniref:Uncharacterized protein n=1 Tax=Sarocladium strictum TaxID=5046 RepID=A0AA39GBB8_SARSR|nr:hypothetical protein NLU13_8260 [Sarocladium strictum]